MQKGQVLSVSKKTLNQNQNIDNDNIVELIDILLSIDENNRDAEINNNSMPSSNGGRVFF